MVSPRNLDIRLNISEFKLFNPSKFFPIPHFRAEFQFEENQFRTLEDLRLGDNSQADCHFETQIKNSKFVYTRIKVLSKQPDEPEKLVGEGGFLLEIDSKRNESQVNWVLLSNESKIIGKIGVILGVPSWKRDRSREPLIVARNSNEREGRVLKKGMLLGLRDRLRPASNYKFNAVKKDNLVLPDIHTNRSSSQITEDQKSNKYTPKNRCSGKSFDHDSGVSERQDRITPTKNKIFKFHVPRQRRRGSENLYSHRGVLESREVDKSNPESARSREICKNYSVILPDERQFLVDPEKQKRYIKPQSGSRESDKSKKILKDLLPAAFQLPDSEKIRGIRIRSGSTNDVLASGENKVIKNNRANRFPRINLSNLGREVGKVFSLCADDSNSTAENTDEKVDCVPRNSDESNEGKNLKGSSFKQENIVVQKILDSNDHSMLFDASLKEVQINTEGKHQQLPQSELDLSNIQKKVIYEENEISSANSHVFEKKIPAFRKRLQSAPKKGALSKNAETRRELLRDVAPPKKEGKKNGQYPSTQPSSPTYRRRPSEFNVDETKKIVSKPENQTPINSRSKIQLLSHHLDALQKVWANAKRDGLEEFKEYFMKKQAALNQNSVNQLTHRKAIPKLAEFRLERMLRQEKKYDPSIWIKRAEKIGRLDEILKSIDAPRQNISQQNNSVLIEQF